MVLFLQIGNGTHELVCGGAMIGEDHQLEHTEVGLGKLGVFSDREFFQVLITPEEYVFYGKPRMVTWDFCG